MDTINTVDKLMRCIVIMDDMTLRTSDFELTQKEELVNSSALYSSALYSSASTA